MSSVPYLPIARERFPVALCLGAWAAAIILAPNWIWKAALALPILLLPVAFWAISKPVRWLAGFFATALLLPPLPVALGDSGPHICLVFAGFGLLSGVINLPRWRLPQSSLAMSLVALTTVLLASVASAALHSGMAIASGSVARVALFGIAVYVFFFTAYGPGSDSRPFPMIRILYGAAFVSALFACVDFYFQLPAPAGYGPQFVWLDSGVYRRAQGFFYEASTLGNFCAFFLVFIVVCFSRPREQAPVSRKTLAAGAVLFLAALVLSYSRASLVNILIAGAVLIWHNRQRMRWGNLARGGIAGLAIASLVLWKLFPAFAETYWDRLTSSAEFLFSATSLSATNGVLSGRVESWQTLAGWIAGHPWETLLGIGYKTLPYTDYLGAPVVGDNMYLSLLVETGVAGLVALVWFNFEVLRAAGRAARHPDPQRALCGLWMLCFWTGQAVQMFSGDLLTYWRVMPVYFFVLALSVRA